MEQFQEWNVEAFMVFNRNLYLFSSFPVFLLCHYIPMRRGSVKQKWDVKQTKLLSQRLRHSWSYDSMSLPWECEGRSLDEKTNSSLPEVLIPLCRILWIASNGELWVSLSRNLMQWLVWKLNGMWSSKEHNWWLSADILNS